MTAAAGGTAGNAATLASALPPAPVAARPRWTAARIGLYAAVGAISAFLLFPVYVIFLLAFLPDNDTIYSPRPPLVPPTLTLSNFTQALTSANSPFLPSMYFSLEIAFLVGGIALLIGIPTAYGLSRLTPRLAYGLTTVMFVVNMLPSITIALPISVQFIKAGLYGSAISIALAEELLALPVTVFLLVGAFHALPPDLENQARVDGASRLQAIFGNLVPLIRPALVASFLLAWMLSWDESTFALILSNPVHSPLAVEIFYSVTSRGNAAYAVAFSFIATVPVLILVVVLQRYLKGEDLAVGVRG